MGVIYNHQRHNLNKTVSELLIGLIMLIVPTFDSRMWDESWKFLGNKSLITSVAHPVHLDSTVSSSKRLF